MEITLLPEQRGQGASRVILDAMRAHASALGYRHMFAPVRPTAKHLEPFTPIDEYVGRRTAEGLPADPWLRVHVRAGGVIVKVAPASMVIPGTIAEWSRWASMSFPASGQIAVPGARAHPCVVGAGPGSLCRTERLGAALRDVTAPTSLSPTHGLVPLEQPPGPSQSLATVTAETWSDGQPERIRQC